MNHAQKKQQFEEKLIEQFGKKKGSLLYKKYGSAFPLGYYDEYPVTTAIADIEHLEKLSAKNPLEITIYRSTEKSSHPLHLRLYQWSEPIPLSDILPMLENMDLRTDNERPYKITLPGHQMAWISDFSVVYSKAAFDIEEVEVIFQEAFSKVYFGLVENDGFNKLVLGAHLEWRDILILRTMAKYLRQVEFRFSQAYIEKALANNPLITKNLVQLFKCMHNPAHKSKPTVQTDKIEKEILQRLDMVTSLDEDRIIRRALDVIKAILRTNYFQTTEEGTPKEYLSIKLNSQAIPDLPLPSPLYEIFVYSPRFEAIHLRYSKVARGGLRWSDRLEDFRTEILGLMKAQVVKNAVIVPSGAKGGFVLKKNPVLSTREAIAAEVIFCYKSFIRGMLDITDNIVNKQIIHPKDVVCYDGDDPYLVVAADKGTAAFSDIANQISIDYHFWLNDAFASGGSTGYDHKKMGITARGAWESIKRHFLELNLNATNAQITVVGVGDMSGDVFGNGMIYSKHLKLIAAFDHRNIFIDPDPDPEISYYERVRLFDLPQSSWEDYNTKLISKGGGVFKRSVKSINISSQMKRVLDINDDSLTPNDLVKAILKAPVDLFYNGGIGTYVKASTQSQADVEDRANDYCRVNGNELRCKVVGEGGNLGFTQLGRVEYASKGGLIFTDFIDNSGGVDCSDHEVNLKILLDNEVNKKKLSMKQRNQILSDLTKEIAELVLHDNYEQALVLSYSAYSAKKLVALHTDYIKDLESDGVLNRKVEFLPDQKLLLERKAGGEGLTRPELAVLLAYTKIYIKHKILKTDLPENDFLHNKVKTAFPASLSKKFAQAMSEHPLHRDIIATQLSNHLVNEMGITFVYRLQVETGATIDEIIRAYTIAANIYGTAELERVVQSLDFKIEVSEEYEILFHLRNLLNLTTRWFLHSGYLKKDLATVIEHFSTRIRKLENLIPEMMAGYTKEYLQSLTTKFQKEGLPKEIAQRIATFRAIYTTLNIIQVATDNNFDLVKTAKVYFAGGERINLVWFRDQIATDAREGHWNILARLTLRDELDISQRALTVAIMKKDKKEKDAKKLIRKWTESNHHALARWDRLLAMLHGSSNIEYSMFFIAIRELIGLILSSE